MRIREGDPLEIYTSREGEVIFKKYSLLGSVEEFASQLCETLSKSSGFICAVTDRDTVVAVAGGGRRELLGKQITAELEQIMESRKIYQRADDGPAIPAADGCDRLFAAVAAPIASEGDLLGAAGAHRPGSHAAHRRDRIQAGADHRGLSGPPHGELNPPGIPHNAAGPPAFQNPAANRRLPMTKIDIFSGFLGAGKTTLIRKLIKEAYAGQKIVLIENEFGEIAIDGGFLKDAGVQITEMNSGCICCTLVGDFKAALEKVIDEYAPDRIIIEPSGVGKLSDVAKAVSTVAGKAELGAKVTVVDANKCKMYIRNFGEFFNDQVKNADVIVLSRTGDIDEKSSHRRGPAAGAQPRRRDNHHPLGQALRRSVHRGHGAPLHPGGGAGQTGGRGRRR
jgi:stage V sporulation protein T